ncbi:C40 family peptidase [Apilactobacillus xinyiensis]|uniref:C40 family peptidase n=1 Tax=Apilactobacillus xinyiensis TaxID=2841032 RepID=UPI001C7D9894|nr:NlpC/P60 family protein [Apilactobacillus xinyiensis]
MKIRKISIFCLSFLAVLVLGIKVNAQNYQNPKKYYQIQSSQIKPYGKVGYNLNIGYEGIKTYKVMRRLGTYGGYNKYNYATKYAVKNFQRKHHLKANGIVDEQTWVKLGFSKSDWSNIDSYVAPLGAKDNQGRKAHIEAAIKQAYKYLGNPYIYGASSSPKYGTDCSGLVMQALYAGGIDPKPISSIHHAYPGNEWNSRNLFASHKFKHVAYKNRKRGDLIFYYQPGTHTIWHVALYLGRNRVIESWPPRIMVAAIRNGQRSDVAGVARPWN